MKVKSLIEQLDYMDPEADVHFGYNYGDYWRTQLAPRVSSVDAGWVKYSSYHRMDAEADKDSDADTGEWHKQVRQVVILK